MADSTPFGLTPFSYQTMCAELAHYPEIERAVVFGSRAMGTYRRGSDVDICLFGAELTSTLVWHIHARLNEELPIPYFFDVLAFDHIKSQELRQHIEQFGQELYRAGIAA